MRGPRLPESAPLLPSRLLPGGRNLGLPQMAQPRSCQPLTWRGFSTAPPQGGQVQECVSPSYLMNKDLSREHGPGQEGSNSETSVVTKHWHFCVGEDGRQANSVLLQPYRKPAWPRCQPAAVYGPCGQREGGREEKGKHRPLPTPIHPTQKIDLELFLGAYSSHTFLFKSQDMGSV